MKIEKQIKTYLKNNGISSSEAADMLGITNSNLSRLLNGRRKMRADELVVICGRFGLDLSFFKSLSST